MQEVIQQTRNDTMYYGNIPILIYHINYPSFYTTCNRAAAQAINEYYRQTAMRVEWYCRTALYSQALERVGYRPDNRPPFNSYTLDVNFKVTYNHGCITSLYIDTYAYLGGAHGETKRTSDTWDFSTGAHLRLIDMDLWSPESPYKLKEYIEQQIAERLKSNPGSYFDDYSSLLQTSFNPDSYYLLPGGYVIYFQQYEIAPYATGLPEFFYPAFSI